MNEVIWQNKKDDWYLQRFATNLDTLKTFITQAFY